jgi:thiol:disulfide interchange protein DsbD
MKRGWFVFMLLPIIGLFVFGQKEPPIVTVKVVSSAASFQPGGTYRLTLEVNIRAPYHISAEQPLDEFLIGTTVDFKPQSGVIYKNVAFPQAEMKKLDISDKPMAVYEGLIKVAAELTLAPDFKNKELAIEGKLGYQACDDRLCLPPTDAAFSKKIAVAVEVAAPNVLTQETKAKKDEIQSATEQKTDQSQAGIRQTTAPKDEAKTTSKSYEQKSAGLSEARKEKAATIGEGIAGSIKKETGKLEGKGLPLVFILVFLGGLALNLTPCVYPLIPITISYFGGQTQGKKGSLVVHSVLYIIGMAVTYSILGVIAALTGSLFGAALQYPPVLIAIATIMIILALGMFNVYELRLPVFLNRLAGGSRKGFFGTFFMGLTVGIVAAPCIGPFVLGLLTYVGDKGNVILGFSLFFVLAMGLGVPFLLLAIFSGSLSRLPRSGAWMVWVRTIFGFVLVGMAVYFLQTLLPSPLFYHLALALTMLVAGVYLAWIEPTKTPGKIFLYVRNITGVVLLGLALYVAATGIQGYLDEHVAAKIRMLSSDKSAAAKIDAVEWFPYAEDKIAEAGRSEKPVFIDFYADWCIPCKEMDRKTFSDPEVIAASKSFVMLKGDLTAAADPQTKVLEQKYQIRGVPTLVFLTSDGREIAELRGAGFEPKKDFLPRMKQALDLNKKKE